MTALHAHFTLRNQQAFQRLLDASAKSHTHSSQNAPGLTLSSSGGRSWTKGHAFPSSLTNANGGLGTYSSNSGSGVVDVNARDWLGRTVLHLAVSAIDAAALEYVRLLLAHPGIDVNAIDGESRWSALHRALYAGNLAACNTLLQRSDIDVSAKDYEGYTAFDLYNSTVEGTKPEGLPVGLGLGYTSSTPVSGAINHSPGRVELFTWGANRNASLGLGDGDDRAYPDQVVIQPPHSSSSESSPYSSANIPSSTFSSATSPDGLSKRLMPLQLVDVGMSKLHTAILTGEEGPGNLRLCGFGSGGRLGLNQHTQYTPTPLPALQAHIVSLALAQDHTLVLTSGGFVLSWGLNRFSQLGYVIEPPSSALPYASSPYASSMNLGGSVDGAIGAGSGSGSGMGMGFGNQEALLVQSVPRRVYGLLKKERVCGIAACRSASACFTDRAVFTWGMNSGQLGYDKAASPVQVLPRVVARITERVIGIAITDNALAYLTHDNDVYCISNDRHFKINFPSQTFPSSIQVYRPPVAINNANIAKIIAGDAGSGNLFAALSANGEVFTFGLGELSSGGGEKGNLKVPSVKPSRVWSLRKQFTAVKDVALGPEGSIILCTESGHVYVQTRALKASSNPLSSLTSGGKAMKFQRVPFVQRVVKVCANSMGAFAAVRVDAGCERIGFDGARDGDYDVKVGGLDEGLREVVPFLATLDEEKKDEEEDGGDEGEVKGDLGTEGILPSESRRAQATIATEVEDDDSDAVIVAKDIELLGKLCDIVKEDKEIRKVDGGKGLGLFGKGGSVRHGADLVVCVQGMEVPVHRVVVAARCKALEEVLDGRVKGLQSATGNVSVRLAKSSTTTITGTANGNSKTLPRLLVSGVHALSVLVLLMYLYTDDLLAPWDSRIGMTPVLQAKFAALNVNPGTVKTDLAALVKVLGLGGSGPNAKLGLEEAVSAPVKRNTARGGLSTDMKMVFEQAQKGLENGGDQGIGKQFALGGDTLLVFADKTVVAHSVVLRARSQVFRGFFDEEEWTRKRWSEEGIVEIAFGHLKWRVMQVVLRHLYTDEGVEVFEGLDFIQSVDNIIDFMFDVLAAATEFFLDRLILECSAVILKHVTITNACSILSDATYYSAMQLKRSVQGYLARNLETALESRILDNLSPEIIKELSGFIRVEQGKKLKVTRSGVLVEKAMEAHGDWLALQDTPQVIVPRVREGGPLHRSPKLSPVQSTSHSAGLDRTTTVTFSVAPMSPLVITPRDSRMPNSARISTPRTTSTPTPGDTSFSLDDQDQDLLFNMDMEQADSRSQNRISGSGSGSETGSVWKSKTPKVAAKIDLKQIMAEAAQSGKAIPARQERRPPSWSPSSAANAGSSPKGPPVVPSQQERRQVSQSGGARVPERASGELTWRQGAPTVALSSGTPSVTRAEPVPGLRRTATTEQKGKAVVMPGGGNQVSPGLGPTFVPSRQEYVPSKTVVPSRKVGPSRSDRPATAWSAMSAVTPSTPSVQSSPMSFVAIQQQQRKVQAPKVKQTLLEIQAEEREKQAEEDFMKWWAAEEERLKLESQGASGKGSKGKVVVGNQSQDGKKSKNPRKKKGPAKEKDANAASSSRAGQNKNAKREQQEGDV